MNILVCPLSRVQQCAASWAPTAIISVLDPGSEFPVVAGIGAERHLRLEFHDAHEQWGGVTLAQNEDLVRLVAFLDRSESTDRLLIHCRAGIGRSTAVAFVAACHQWPEVAELDLVRELRRVAPLARPNETVVGLADACMNRQGRMLAAIVDTGRWLPWVAVSEGIPFELNAPPAE